MIEVLQAHPIFTVWLAGAIATLCWLAYRMMWMTYFVAEDRKLKSRARYRELVDEGLVGGRRTLAIFLLISLSWPVSVPALEYANARNKDKED